MSLILPTLLLAVALSAPADRPDLDQLRPGMTAAEVRELLGPPKRMARQIVHKRCLEQWVYDAPVSVRIELNAVQGQPLQILTVQPIISPKP